MIVAFCGHADYAKKEEDKQTILALLEREVGDKPCDFFLGEYGAFDSLAYECARDFQKKHPSVKLIFITPYLSPNYRKNIDASKKFDQIIYPELEKVPPRYAVLRRNRWIVEQAEVLIAYVDHRYGGAYRTYQYALTKKKRIYNTAPCSAEKPAFE